MNNICCIVFRDLLRTTTAETLFTYEDEFFEGLSAITLNKYQGGNVYYIGCGVDENIMDKLADKILKDSKIETIKSPKGVEVVRRNINNEEKYFVMNHTDKTQQLGDKVIKPYEAFVVDSI